MHYSMSMCHKCGIRLGKTKSIDKGAKTLAEIYNWGIPGQIRPTYTSTSPKSLIFGWEVSPKKMQILFDLGPLGAELRAFQIFESLGYAQISSGNISAIKNDTKSYEVSTWRKWLVEIKSGEIKFLLPPKKKLDPRGGHSRHPGHIIPNFFGFLTLENFFN